ncbi:prepilin-type N-terminal cleavage/methylation domain-containing protein [Pontiella sp.]|uniref:prepilin-type N-terminal cleavage/methylation domain-containing protein n=1 Tax=Pontiella sp. TaxID=2837462 RepID=UPI00356B599B
MNNRDGFSLLEVLVALVVFAVGVTGMLTALGYNLRDISFTEDHAMAVRMASREMNALRRFTYVPESESSGEEGRFSWMATVTAMDLDELPGMDGDDESLTDALVPCELEVTVSWSDDVDGDPVHRVKLNGIELFEDE